MAVNHQTPRRAPEWGSPSARVLNDAADGAGLRAGGAFATGIAPLVTSRLNAGKAAGRVKVVKGVVGTKAAGGGNPSGAGRCRLGGAALGGRRKVLPQASSLGLWRWAVWRVAAVPASKFPLGRFYLMLT